MTSWEQRRTIKIQEVSTQGYSSCATAKKVLEEEIKPQFPDVEIEYIDLFSVGGLDKKKLIEKLKQLSSA